MYYSFTVEGVLNLTLTDERLERRRETAEEEGADEGLHCLSV